MKEKIFNKGIKRRLFSVVLAMAMIVSLLPTISITTYATSASHQSGTCTDFAGITYIQSNWYCFKNDRTLNHIVSVADQLQAASLFEYNGSEVWIDSERSYRYQIDNISGEIVYIADNKIYVCTNHAPGEGYCDYCGRKADGSLTENAYLIELIKNANSGDTIKLEKDYIINYPVLIEKELTIDLNGHKIQSTKATSAMLVIKDAGKLIITDSSANKTGKIEYTANTKSANAILLVNGGELIVENGNFEVEGTTEQITQCVNILAGNATIHDGTFTITGHKNSSVVACTKNYADKDATLTINGGTLNGTDTLKSFASYKNTSDGDFGTVYIKGGVLNGAMSTDSGNNISYVHITGGTFNQDWSKNGSDNQGQPVHKPLAEIVETDYIVRDNNNGTYTVLRKETWSYSANGSIITAICKGECGTAGAHTATLTLTASNATYTGTAVEATFAEGEADAWKKAVGSDAPDITYEAKPGSSLTGDKAVNVGSYTAKITVDGNTAAKEFKILSLSAPVPPTPGPAEPPADRSFAEQVGMVIGVAAPVVVPAAVLAVTAAPVADLLPAALRVPIIPMGNVNLVSTHGHAITEATLTFTNPRTGEVVKQVTAQELASANLPVGNYEITFSGEVDGKSVTASAQREISLSNPIKKIKVSAKRGVLEIS